MNISHPPRIQVLDPRVAAGIAAGEVVERPASVVKELAENSLDAGATHVTVELRQGGLEFIRVVDDGRGIQANQLEVAFARHATSKLTTMDDLDSLSTLGFRGEALPSIAAAGHVRLVSRTAHANAAFIEIEGGRTLAAGAGSSALGTSVTVEALFSAIPARLKFMRTSGAEAGRARQVIDHLVLACPHVAFTLVTDGRVALRAPGSGSLRDAVAAVHGVEIADAMLEITPSPQARYPAHGLTCSPSTSRPNRTAIRTFVNGRWVQSRALTAAVEQAYVGLLMEGRYPVSVVLLEVPPDQVDINVHPNKREVRFVHEGEAFSSVQRAVRDALLANVPVAATPHQPSRVEGRDTAATSPSFTFSLPPIPSVSAAQPLIDTAAAPALALDELRAGAAPLAGATMPRLRVLGQIANTYVVAEGADGMYLVDQHAAHESVLFYRLLRHWARGEPEIQPLLDPVPVPLTPAQQDAVAEALPTLAAYGFILEDFGDGTWLLRAVPAMSRAVPAEKMIEELLAEGVVHPHGATPSHWAMAASIACHSAVRAGQSLSDEEMTELIHAMETTADPSHCPHGRPTTIRVTTSMLERAFGRA